jgi:hypothetical protein
VRPITFLLLLGGALVLSGAASARDLRLPKMDAAALKSVCDKAGGKFSLGPRGVGCGTNCHGGPGTDCIVHCVTGERCTAQVIGSRRPRSVADALTRPQRKRR